jgi:hypothetical protein
LVSIVETLKAWIAWILVPILTVVRLPLTGILWFGKVTKPADVSPEAKYVCNALRSIGSRIHHIFAVPLLAVEWVDDGVGWALRKANEAASPKLVVEEGLPEPRELEFCGSGCGKAQVEQKYEELAKNAKALEEALDEIQPRAAPSAE